jgi:hypothetical protein
MANNDDDLFRMGLALFYIGFIEYLLLTNNCRFCFGNGGNHLLYFSEAIASSISQN